MSLVGDKKVFAIEWYIHNHHDHEGCFYANIRFWGNEKAIGIWNVFEPMHFTVSRAKDCLCVDSYPNIPSLDFSGITKEDAYKSIRDSNDLGIVYQDKYRDFYKQCKEMMLKEYDTLSGIAFTEERRQQSIFLGDNFEEDLALSTWIYRFVITDDFTETFLQDLNMICVKNTTKNQERLIWKYHDMLDDEGNIEHEFPIEEAVLPVGYFRKVLEKFVEVASKEMEAILNGKDYNELAQLYHVPCILQAVDLDAHKGYQQWHRDLDARIADWLERNKEATQQQFIDQLKIFYSDPDLAAKFPDFVRDFNNWLKTLPPPTVK